MSVHRGRLEGRAATTAGCTADPTVGAKRRTRDDPSARRSNHVQHPCSAGTAALEAVRASAICLLIRAA
jgi:hypothetical protein